MNNFPETIHQYWKIPFSGKYLYRDDHLSIFINPELEDDESVTILHSSRHTHTEVALLPDVAQSLHAIGISGDVERICKVSASIPMCSLRH